jgi:hypothetical protein
MGYVPLNESGPPLIAFDDQVERFPVCEPRQLAAEFHGVTPPVGRVYGIKPRQMCEPSHGPSVDVKRSRDAFKDGAQYVLFPVTWRHETDAHPMSTSCGYGEQIVK